VATPESRETALLEVLDGVYMTAADDKQISVLIGRKPDTSATRHFGTETLRYHKIGAEV